MSLLAKPWKGDAFSVEFNFDMEVKVEDDDEEMKTDVWKIIDFCLIRPGTLYFFQ